MTEIMDQSGEEEARDLSARIPDNRRLSFGATTGSKSELPVMEGILPEIARLPAITHAARIGALGVGHDKTIWPNDCRSRGDNVESRL